MSSTIPESEDSGGGGSRRRSHLNLDVGLSVNRETKKALFDELRRLVREAVKEELSAYLAMSQPIKETSIKDDQAKTVERGIELPPEEQLKAKDLRIALLLGKVPEEAGILIDTSTTAKLLNVSHRTLDRLADEKAIPQPVRISGRLVRWRLAELLEWIEEGCPHPTHWTYSPTTGSRTRGRK
jgi:excisionase family DNA binding protein